MNRRFQVVCRFSPVYSLIFATGYIAWSIMILVGLYIMHRNIGVDGFSIARWGVLIVLAISFVPISLVAGLAIIYALLFLDRRAIYIENGSIYYISRIFKLGIASDVEKILITRRDRVFFRQTFIEILFKSGRGRPIGTRVLDESPSDIRDNLERCLRLR